MKSHKKLFFWVIVISFAVLIVLYFTQKRNRAANEKMYFSYSMLGEKVVGKLGIQSPDLTSQELLKGVLCVSDASNVSKVDLYMPDMGHGSSPPVVSKAKSIPSTLNLNEQDKNDYGCFNISKMEMFMPGLWQVRVFYNNGENGYFDINLDK